MAKDVSSRRAAMALAVRVPDARARLLSAALRSIMGSLGLGNGPCARHKVD